MGLNFVRALPQIVIFYTSIHIKCCVQQRSQLSCHNKAVLCRSEKVTNPRIFFLYWLWLLHCWFLALPSRRLSIINTCSYSRNNFKNYKIQGYCRSRSISKQFNQFWQLNILNKLLESRFFYICTVVRLYFIPRIISKWASIGMEISYKRIVHHWNYSEAIKLICSGIILIGCTCILIR